MVRRFRVESDDVSTGFGKVRDDTIHWFHHQMHVNQRASIVRQITNGITHQWTNGQVRHVMVIHHVKVNDVGAGFNDVFDFLA